MKVTEKQVRRLLSKWRRQLEIDHKWDIDITIHAVELAESEDNRDAYCHITTQRHCFTAQLVVNAWKIPDLRHLDRSICHECGHLIVEESHTWTALMCAFGDRFEQLGREMLESMIEHYTMALTRRR